MKKVCSIALLGAGLFVTVFARGAATPETQASAPIPPLIYRSAFEDYRPFRDEPIGEWRALNDEVRKAGGHVGILRGANRSTNQPPQPPAGDRPKAAAPAHPHGH